jgi:uncharacterized OsmC-like protein
LENVSVRLTNDRVHAADARNCATGRCMIDRMELVLDLDGPLTDDQRQRLLEIAERCPVHRTLLGEKQIVTRLAVPLASHATQPGTEPATDRERASIGSSR